jgi:hypothetical protein
VSEGESKIVKSRRNVDFSVIEFIVYEYLVILPFELIECLLIADVRIILSIGFEVG